MTALAFTALGALLVAALAGLLLAERARSRRAIWLTKPVASLAFVGLAVASDATGSPYGLFVLTGLVLSLVGDVLLVPANQRAFVAGLGAFLAAHVAYVGAFIVLGPTWTWTLGALVVLSLVAVPVGRWLLPHVEAPMRGPVVAYMLVITTMVALAVGVVSSARGAWVVPAAALFYVSDLTVARDRFVREGFENRLVGLPLYYGAQVLFALSV